MCLHHGAAQREAKAHAFLLAGLEGVEQFSCKIIRDAGAVVGHMQVAKAARTFGPTRDTGFMEPAAAFAR